MADKKVKITNTDSKKSVFVTNPNRVKDPEPGTPVHLLQKNFKLLPGQSIEIDEKEAKAVKAAHSFIK